MTRGQGFYQGIYRDPITNKLIVKIFSFDDFKSCHDFNEFYASSVAKAITEIFRINISITPIYSEYYNKETDNPAVAYTDIEKILELTANGDELNMSIFDDIAEEFAYNEEYQKFLNNRFMNMNLKALEKDTIMKVYNYIADKAVAELQYHLEMVTENWEKWKANGFKPSDV